MELIKQLENTKQQTLKFFKLTDDKLDKSYAKGKWTVKEILHHIADAETVLYDRIRRIISEEKPVIWAFDQDAWCKALNYKEMPLIQNEIIYQSVRDSITGLAENFYLKLADKEFIHSETGLRTLKDEFDKVAVHNKHHLEQIAKAIT